jgi:hypothetical protein
MAELFLNGINEPQRLGAELFLDMSSAGGGCSKAASPVATNQLRIRSHNGSEGQATAGHRMDCHPARGCAAVDELVELIANSHARWMPRVVEAIFTTNDPVSVAEALTEAVAATLAVPVAAAQFYEPGVGVVVGLDLADGRAVVAKVDRATLMPIERLATIAHVQADLVAAGVPAPAPLAGPLVLGNGWLTVEEHRGCDSADGYDPAVRRGMASALHDFVAAARPHAGSGWTGTTAACSHRGRRRDVLIRRSRVRILQL